MVSISEFLPNPVGADTTGEWVELANDSNVTAVLHGWHLTNASGKKIALDSYTVPAQGFLILTRPITKLTLRNQDEILSLYDQSGTLVDQARFRGLAPEGKSVNRAGSTWVLGEPSPLLPNVKIESALIHNAYPSGVPINYQMTNWMVGALTLGVALLLTMVVLYAFPYITNLQEFFHRGDPEIR